MFKNLFDLSVKRTGFEIFGFYIVYSIFGAIVAGIICGFLIAAVHPEIKTVQEATRLAIKYAPVLAMAYGLIISLAIVKAKNIFNSFQIFRQKSAAMSLQPQYIVEPRALTARGFKY